MKTQNKTSDMILIALSAIIIAICSWISIPTVVPFTLQTFGVFFVVGVLGGKRGTMAVIVYLLLGLIGIPVFAGFTGGIGVLSSNRGGYLIGFLLSACIMWLFEILLGQKIWVLALSMGIGLFICYAFGTAWFLLIYLKQAGTIGLGTVLGWCVVPFIIPDIIKISLVLVLSKRVKKSLELASR